MKHATACATVLLALAFNAGSAHAAAQLDCDIDGKAVNPVDAKSLADKSGVMRCKDRDTGKLASESTLDDGHEVGLIRNFHPDGSLRRVSFRDESGADRAVAEFTPRGQLSLLRCADKPLLAPVVDDARLCGFGKTTSTVELFDINGLLRSRITWLNGKRLRSESLYDNGKVATQEEFNGKRRVERRFSSEGIKRLEVVFAVLDRGGVVKQREEEFSEKGILVRDQQWDDAGEPLRDDSYSVDGKPRSKVSYSGRGDSRVADVTEFHDNGQRAAQGRFLAPARAPLLPIGIHRRFNDKGTLVTESTYDAKGQATRERTFDDSGAQVHDQAVAPDGTRKAGAQ
ncbi:hypothetical protein QTI66_26630 [Variovorax sp. J22R133]|uniref:hypothetical protein n=1 Tax=Variovorax brevis TaxID=3053503 RepID=UPI002578D2B1|nr:hypothetical protein [Variovorax sp. J22R133]MDM0115754.1 hypothetical protein [Variovorax sp. J22R133]